MSILFSKELLMAETKCTLTVSTNPASATCTLTYDGQSYSSKSATVKKGTVISYSVYHSTYGTKTGSVTMDSDKTLAFEGTYSTSTVETNWSQPTLSSNGTLGGSSFAVEGSSEYYTGYEAYKAFDSYTTGEGHYWRTKAFTSGYLHDIILYNPTALKITNISYLNYGQTAVSPISGTVYGSSNGSNWTQIATYTNTVYTVNQAWNISLSSNTNYYKYYKVTFQNSASAGFLMCAELGITAKYQQTSYTYYWEVTTT